MHVYIDTLFPDITHFPLFPALLLDHLGEPVDLDLNADGKTDDQTVQLRPKAPSKPPRTFVSTDLDPNYRVDHRGYQEEIDVPESEGIEAADQKSESSAHAINLQDDGHDERVLSPHAKKPVKKKQKKKNKQTNQKNKAPPKSTSTLS